MYSLAFPTSDLGSITQSKGTSTSNFKRPKTSVRIVVAVTTASVTVTTLTPKTIVPSVWNPSRKDAIVVPGTISCIILQPQISQLSIPKEEDGCTSVRTRIMLQDHLILASWLLPRTSITR